MFRKREGEEDVYMLTERGEQETEIIIIKLFGRIPESKKGQEPRKKETWRRFKVAQQTKEVTG